MAGGKVQLFSDSACTQAISETVATSSTSATITTNPLPVGAVSVYAKAEDGYRNISTCSVAFAAYEVLFLKKDISNQISSRNSHTCALTSSGRVKCWGHLERGVSIDLISGKGSTTPLSNIVQISSGNTHTCALTYSGGVKCWGGVWYRDNMQLGDGKIYDSRINYPVDVISGKGSTAPLINIVQISSGNPHTCALTSSGGVKCWGGGASYYGHLGDGKAYDSSPYGTSYPVDVISGKGSTTHLSNIVQISSGNGHTCALTSSGGVKCWGGKANYPVDVISEKGGTTPLSNIVQISSRENHTCALTSYGRVKCWGASTGASTANVVLGKDSTTPLSNIVQVSSGYSYTCALTSFGGVKCWGNPSRCYGQLGDGKIYDSSSCRTNYPIDVISGKGSTTPLSNIVEVSLGDSHTCALTSFGGVKCWGLGHIGQLGNGKSGGNHIDSWYQTNYPVDVISGKDSTTPLNIGNYKVTYACNNGSCNFVPESLIALELRNPDPSATPYASDTPNIRLHHVSGGQSVSLHLDAACVGVAVASGTVAIGAATIDLTTDALTARENNIYAKVGTLCTTNQIPYTYSGGI